VKSSASERRHNHLLVVPQDDNHVVADRANRIIRSGHERLWAVSTSPFDELLRPAHAPAAPRGKNDSDSARIWHE
jgi:hypothetical protein